MPSRDPASADGDRVALGTLGLILGSESSEGFLRDVLGRRHLHCPNDDPERFSDLLSIEVLDAVLGVSGLKTPDVRLVQLDRDIPFREYEWRNGLVDPMRVARLFSEGATVVFGGLQDRHEPLRRLCAGLTSESGGRTQTNIYLTPPGSQGFKPHWDTHDVFVLQVSGSKAWRMYEGGPRHPLRHQKFDPDRHVPGDVQLELTLAAGETLYIPRGQMHAAEATDEISLHITLGLIPYTWADLAADCIVDLVEESPRWREDVPFRFSGDSGFEKTAHELAERLRGLPHEIDVASVLMKRRDATGASHRPRAPDYLRQASTAGGLTPEDRVAVRPELASRVEARNGRLLVHVGNRQLDFPAAARTTIETLLAGGELRAGQIQDGLDWSGRKTVLGTLIREGLVVRSP